VTELEIKNLLDEQTSSLIKSLILEENIEVFKYLNQYYQQFLNDIQLR
jgi:hypothetical protein